MSEKKKSNTPQQLWDRLSSTFVNFVETKFFVLGVCVARNPWKIIVLTCIFVVFSCGGLFNFYMEKDPIKLWVPPDSDFYQDTKWYMDNFGVTFRLQKILITANNVLDPEVLKVINNISNHMNTLEVEYKSKIQTLNDLCFKVPIVNFGFTNISGTDNLRSSKKIDYSDFSLWLDDSTYCSLIENFPVTCLQDNILDLWHSNQSLIFNTTELEIVTKINKVKTNPVTGHPQDYRKLLGGVEYGSNGDIISAKSIILTWFMYVNMTDANLDEVGNLVGTEEWVSMPLAIWEKQFLNYAQSLQVQFKGLNFYYESGRSFADTSGEAMIQDMDKLFFGIFAMFCYVLFAISRFNWLEIRLTLGGLGLMSVGLAYITTIGWCSAFGIPFGPVHSSLPFLLMGLGLDDMFVMNACWKLVVDSENLKSTPHNVGHMLKHAGVSIVITSFTDIVALLVGAITILPSLKSFCIYAAVGVFFIFCYSVTFFVAVFTLDLKRIESNRNGLLFCYKHKNNIPLSNEETFLSNLLAKFYKNIILTLPGKIIVILITVVITGVSIRAMLRLEQRFDPKWFVPEGSYYKSFLTNYEHYYPEEGNLAMVFLGDMDYNLEFKKLHNMTQVLKNKPYVLDMDSWVETFHMYILKNYDCDLLDTGTEISDSKFKAYLSRFLFSAIGGRFQLSFKFSEHLYCGGSIKDILASSVSFKFPRLDNPEVYIPIMNSIKHIVKSTNITTGTGYRSVWSKSFGNWATDEIIAVEVERNIELALLCVMICTVVLITNLQMCLWIFICVLLTIINVLGFMQRWDMTVDIVCCIGLELAIGLCVDYAAHIGHTFLTMSEGSRNERAFMTVRSIGSAVLLGGGSTLLSLSFLSMSKAYTFQSFFKIFLLVILFGLFHGLIFLPVVLSLVGPSRSSNSRKDLSPEAVELNAINSNKENGMNGNEEK